MRNCRGGLAFRRPFLFWGEFGLRIAHTHCLRFRCLRKRQVRFCLSLIASGVIKDICSLTLLHKQRPTEPANKISGLDSRFAQFRHNAQQVIR